MRQLASFLLFGFALVANASETWRWKDANGVHYSDRPVPGAELVHTAPSKPGSPAVAATASAPTSFSSPQEQATAATSTVRYTSCAVSSPANDEVFNAVNAVSASLQFEPALQEGHRVQVFLNGRVYVDWPEGVVNYTLQNLFRGSYALGARIIDATGRPVCTTPSITFHVRQPSVLSPGRRPAR
jgi:hypothetical protein